MSVVSDLVSLVDLDKSTISNMNHTFFFTATTTTATTTGTLFSNVKKNMTLSLGFGIGNDANTRRTIHYTMAIILTIIGIIGTVGNGLVLYIFSKHQRLRSGGGPLILSLASGDLMVSVLHILPAYSSFMETWAFGVVGCEIYAAAVGVGGLASLITLSAIATDRFCVIFGKPISWLARQTTCVCIWALSLALVLPPFFGWSKFCLEGMGTSCSWDYSSRTLSNRFYYVFLLFFGFVLPVTVIIVSYIGILRVVCKHSKAMDGFSRNGVICTQSPTKTDIRTAQVVFTLILCFLISWTPYAIVSLIGQFGRPDSLSQLSTALPALFAKTSVIYNPFIYGLSHPYFRSAVKSVWTKSSTMHGNFGQQQCYQPSPFEDSTRPRGSQNQNLLPFINSKSPIMIGHSKRLLRPPSKGYTLSPRGMAIRNERIRSLSAGGGGGSESDVEPVTRNSRHEWHAQFRKSSHYNNGYEERRHERQHLTLGNGQFKRKRIHSLGPNINHSEPDLHRDDRIVKNSNLITQTEYRRRKHSWLRKVLFRSENCLDHILRSDGFNHMAKLGNIDTTSLIKKNNFRHVRKQHHCSPRHAPYASTMTQAFVTIHGSPSSLRSSSSNVTPLHHYSNPSPRRSRTGSGLESSRKKSTTSILHHSNKEKRDSNLLTLPLRFEDGISSGHEDDPITSSRRSSSGRKSSSSGSKGSSHHGQKRLCETSPQHSYFRRKSSNNSEGTGALSHCASSQRSGSQSQSQSKKFSFESTASKHQCNMNNAQLRKFEALEKSGFQRKC